MHDLVPLRLPYTTLDNKRRYYRLNRRLGARADHIRYLVQDGAALRTRHKVLMLDYAPFRLLVNLIRGARGVLFPSLYEGFGLPALEAMLLGTPVVTSNTASMPEVVGDAAITVDPYDVSALVRAIQAVDGDAELRARLAEAGPRRAALFSPERYSPRLEAPYGPPGPQPWRWRSTSGPPGYGTKWRNCGKRWSCWAGPAGRNSPSWPPS